MLFVFSLWSDYDRCCPSPTQVLCFHRRRDTSSSSSAARAVAQVFIYAFILPLKVGFSFQPVVLNDLFSAFVAVVVLSVPLDKGKALYPVILDPQQNSSTDVIYVILRKRWSYETKRIIMCGMTQK